MKQIIATPDAPPAIGPYAQGVKIGDHIYVSGQLPLDPRTRQIVPGGIAAQTEQVLLNIQAILGEAEATLDHVVKFTIFMTNLDEFDEMIRIFAMFFPTGDNSRRLPTARSTVEVSRLPRDVSIEMEAIAVLTPETHDYELY